MAARRAKKNGGAATPTAEARAKAANNQHHQQFKCRGRARCGRADNTSLREQTGACVEVATFLEQVFEGTRSNDDAREKFGCAMQDLLSRTGTLREDVKHYHMS